MNEAAVGDNHQPIEGDTPSLNRQAAPEDAPPGPNNQAVDNGKVLSHFEKTPDTAVVRHAVDLSHATHRAFYNRSTDFLPMLVCCFLNS